MRQHPSYTVSPQPYFPSRFNQTRPGMGRNSRHKTFVAVLCVSTKLAPVWGVTASTTSLSLSLLLSYVFQSNRPGMGRNSKFSFFIAVLIAVLRVSIQPPLYGAQPLGIRVYR